METLGTLENQSVYIPFGWGNQGGQIDHCGQEGVAFRPEFLKAYCTLDFQGAEG